MSCNSEAPLRLEAPDNSQFLLGFSMLLQKQSVKIRNEEFKVPFRSGVIAHGGEVEAREISVRGLVVHEDRYQHWQWMADLRQYCRRPRLKLKTEYGYYYNITKVLSIDGDWIEMTGRRGSEIDLRFQCADPFEYSEQLNAEYFSLNGDQTVYINTEATYPVSRERIFPLIRMTAAGPNTTWGLKNVTDGGLQFEYSDQALNGGAVLDIDCEAATVKRDDTNTLDKLNGEFISLLPGLNQLDYTGFEGVLEVFWRAKWL